MIEMFSVGDIIVSEPDNGYSITDNKMSYAIVSDLVGCNSLRIIILQHQYPEAIGFSYTVNNYAFKHANIDLFSEADRKIIKRIKSFEKYRFDFYYNDGKVYNENFYHFISFKGPVPTKIILNKIHKLNIEINHKKLICPFLCKGEYMYD